ncbi:WD40 repeat-like protein [Marasmius fiardii PR-910]|nr:WD40 repeat-like protein [Marasmius fiardii PR-910]
MSMAATKRRVSYTIPAPVDPVPRLRLPDPGTSRFGLTGPLLIPIEGVAEFGPHTHSEHHRARQLPVPKNPRHRLGVTSLALDICTQLVGHGLPEGILYSGGRDGMVNSWDLHVPMRMRDRTRNMSRSRDVYEKYRWEMMTGWADDIDEENDEYGDGDVLGEVTGSLRKRREEASEIPYEERWEIRKDVNNIPPTTFRQCAEIHTEWINDIVLCNYNQTVVSASSDGAIKAWNSRGGDISTLGYHDDYVRCLSVCRDQNWIASGSFDRTIKLWDLGHGSTNPLATLAPVDAAKDPKTSVYALAADSRGHVIASGSPERIVRLWDPRSGKGTGKLVGHTDNIRAILISDDGRYLLTASTDASIKLWSLSSPQRCLHTFTHHTDSVWSLFSTHPSLETFYSGDKCGLVCRVDVSGVGAFESGDASGSLTVVGSSSGIGNEPGFDSGMDVSSGECVLIASVRSGPGFGACERGVDKIVVMDDQLLWTASGTSSEIRRWRVPAKMGRNRGRAVASNPGPYSARERSSSAATTEDDHSRTLHESPESMPVPLPPVGPPKQHRHRSHTNTLSPSLSTSSRPLPRPDSASSNHHTPPPILQRSYAASLVRLPSTVHDIAAFLHKSQAKDPDSASLVSHLRASSPNPSTFSHSRQNFETAELEILPELASEAVPYNTEPDSIIPGDAGLVRCVILNDRIHALTVDTAGEVGVWDIVRGNCLGVYRNACWCTTQSTSLRPSEHHSHSPTRSPAQRHSSQLATQQCQCLHTFSPREALENVRSRIEGEGAVVLPWATCDTKSGVLTVHLNVDRCFDAEIYADEVGFPKSEGDDDLKLNIGKWVLKNLFLGFIREEQRLRKKRESTGSVPSTPVNHPSFPKSRTSIHPIISSPTLIPALPPSALVSLARKVSSPLITPLIPLASLNQELLSGTPQTPDLTTPIVGSISGRATTNRLRSQSLSTGGGVYDTNDLVASPTPHPSGKESADYFSTVSHPSSKPSEGGSEDVNGKDNTAAGNTAQTPITPGGLMTRLKSFGKPKRAASEVISPTPSIPPIVAKDKDKENNEESGSIVSADADAKTTLLSLPLSPPPSSEAPVHTLPSNMTVTISEGHTMVYRGMVSNTGHDVTLLEETMSLWLLECLLFNKLPPAAAQVKVSFILLPWQGEGLSEEEKLPELLNITQSKLTASRWLRVRKLVHHVQDKLEKLASENSTTSRNSPRTSIDSNTPNQGKAAAEDLYEILCNEVVLPLNMTLAAVRQYVWRQAGELTMHYRLKKRVADAAVSL